MRIGSQQFRVRTIEATLFALAICVLPPAASGSAILDYQTTLTLPRGQARIAMPVSVTAGLGGGEVCITDGTSLCGHLYNESNVLVYSTSALAQLSDPIDLTVEAGGDFICTDRVLAGGRTIRRLNFFGEPVPYTPEPPQENWQPQHVLITADGNYVTTDLSGALLCKHDARTGALLWKRSLAVEGEGEVLGVGRPAEAPDGRLYLPIGGDRKIVVLTPEGEPQSSFGVAGTGRGRLAFPAGVAFCPDGTIAVLDRMRSTILLYDAEHIFFAEFGEYGAGPRNLYQPVSIAATADGRVLVAQGFQGRVHVFRFSSTGSAWHTTDHPSPTERSQAVDPCPGVWGGCG